MGSFPSPETPSTTKFSSVRVPVYNQLSISLREGPNLVETSNIDSTSNGNPERLRAVNVDLAEGSKRIIDSHRQFHGQLWGDDRGDDHDTMEQELGLVSVILTGCRRPDIIGSNDSKKEEKEDEKERFAVVGSDSVGRVNNGTDQFPLLCGKSYRKSVCESRRQRKYRFEGRHQHILRLEL